MPQQRRYYGLSKNEMRGIEVRERIVEYIKAYMVRNKMAPTFREIAEGVGLSVANVYTHVEKLGEAGVLDYVAGMPRTITFPDMKIVFEEDV